MNRELKKLREGTIEVIEQSLFEEGNNHENLWGKSIPARRPLWLQWKKQERWSERNCQWWCPVRHVLVGYCEDFTFTLNGMRRLESLLTYMLYNIKFEDMN